jgi:6-phosphogluconolactonase
MSVIALALLPVSACTSSEGTPTDRPGSAGASGAGGESGENGGGGGGRSGTGGGGGARAGSGGASGRGASGSGGASGTSGAGAGGMDAASPQDAAADAADDASVPSGTPFLYVSGYGPEITRFTLDLATGALAEQGRVQGGTSPSYLAFAPNKRALYAVNEASGAGSQVVAFAIDPDTGALTEINRAATGGEGAPHLAVHPSGDWVAVAHYGSGHLSILPVRADGGVEAAVDSQRGPSDGCGRAHQAVFDASGRYLFVPCLQSNYVVQYTFDAGTLGYNDPPTVAVAGGPRHMALDPAEQHAYVLSELNSTITSFAYDAATGRLSSPQVINSYEGNSGAGASAHIAVHPSGKWLYASNRSQNSLGLFSIDAQGRPQPVAFERDMINTPRDFTIDPTGTFLISANQNGAQNLLVYRIAAADGRLRRVQVVPVGGSPTFAGVLFLP